MTPEQYYTAPPDHIFEEIKLCAIRIWSEYDDTHGYATGKINRIKDIQNVQDNAWYMVAMFDFPNQMKLMGMLSEESRAMVMDAMKGE